MTTPSPLVTMYTPLPALLGEAWATVLDWSTDPAKAPPRALMDLCKELDVPLSGLLTYLFAGATLTEATPADLDRAQRVHLTWREHEQDKRRVEIADLCLAGRPIEEIASRLGISLANAQVNRHIAAAALRGGLAEADAPGPELATLPQRDPPLG